MVKKFTITNTISPKLKEKINKKKKNTFGMKYWNFQSIERQQ